MEIAYNPLDICTRSYDEFTVLYDLRNRQILQLENVSADIWNFIIKQNPTTADKISAYISNEYACSIEDVSDDIIGFLQDLYDSGIIQFNGQYIDINTDNPIKENNNSFQDTDDFEGQIITSLEEKNQLYSATLEMTYSCNEKCIHCYAHYPSVDTSSDYLSMFQYKEFLDSLLDLGALHLAFTGGDPFMNKNFIELFKYSRLKGFVSDIFTNGLWLSDHPNQLQEIIELRPRAFYISLYGASPNVHDSITCIPGSFDKTISVVKTIHAAEIPVVFNVMLLKENYDDFKNIIALAKNLDVEYRVGMSLIYRNDGSDSPMAHFINDKEKIKNVLRTIRTKVYSADRPVDDAPSNSDFMCEAGVTSICLSPDGTVYPCVSLKTPLGNIVQSTLEDIWNGSSRLNLINSLKWKTTKECNSCQYKSDCPHCAGMSQAESGDPFSCNTCDRML